MKRILKVGLNIVGIALTAAIVAIIVFVQVSPQFGTLPSEEQEQQYSKLDNWEDGVFQNDSAEFPNPDLVQYFERLFASDSGRRPTAEIPVQLRTRSELEDNRQQDRFFWYGHSAFLMQIESRTVLLDPMLGETPSPHPWFGPSRYFDSLPLPVEELPQIDAVFISHDHYDHLDYPTLEKIRDRVKVFFVPLGVANHLQGWGIPSEKIVEMNWWNEYEWDGVKVVCTPSEHFSGRGLTDQGKTLWCSWVIQSTNSNVYFSGDSGYGTHFGEIGSKYGPFDIAFLECGQYDVLWPSIHMFPEETALSAKDLQARRAMPIHWGAYTLALHTWKDPIERFVIKGDELGIELVYPQIGEWVYIRENRTYAKWWESVQ